MRDRGVWCGLLLRDFAASYGSERIESRGVRRLAWGRGARKEYAQRLLAYRGMSRSLAAAEAAREQRAVVRRREREIEALWELDFVPRRLLAGREPATVARAARLGAVSALLGATSVPFVRLAALFLLQIFVLPAARLGAPVALCIWRRQPVMHGPMRVLAGVIAFCLWVAWWCFEGLSVFEVVLFHYVVRRNIASVLRLAMFTAWPALVVRRAFGVVAQLGQRWVGLPLLELLSLLACAPLAPILVEYAVHSTSVAHEANVALFIAYIFRFFEYIRFATVLIPRVVADFAATMSWWRRQRHHEAADTPRWWSVFIVIALIVYFELVMHYLFDSSMRFFSGEERKARDRVLYQFLRGLVIVVAGVGVPALLVLAGCSRGNRVFAATGAFVLAFGAIGVHHLAVYNVRGAPRSRVPLASSGAFAVYVSVAVCFRLLC